jgi:hypothetical protein
MEWRGIFVAANVGKKLYKASELSIMLGAKDSQTGLVEPNRN